MKARITFRSEVFIEGKDIDEIRNKWENMQIFSSDAIDNYDADLVEVVSVEDADTYENIDLENEVDEDLMEELIEDGYNVAKTALNTIVIYDVDDCKNGYLVNVYDVDEDGNKGFYPIDSFNILPSDCDCRDISAVTAYIIDILENTSEY